MAAVLPPLSVQEVKTMCFLRRLFLMLVLIAGTAWSQRRVSLIVDTSGSMKENDPQRYAAQIAKILGDLVGDGDLVQVVRMPAQKDAGRIIGPGSLRDILRGVRLKFEEYCDADPNPALAVRLRGADRASFKSALDSILVNDTGTFFAQPVHTAIDFLGTSSATPRMLLFLADSGGFDTNCASDLTSDLGKFRTTGAYVGLINLGASAGTFKGNPSFDSIAAAPTSEELVRAVAQSYQRFLGGKKVQTGRANSSISVTIDPYVKEAFVVVAAEGAVQVLGASGGTASSIDENYRGGGTTRDLRGFNRDYRIVRLVNPSAGQWTISAPGVEAGGWMLIQDYSIALRALPVQPVAAGATAKLQFEAYDQRNGQRIADPAALANMRVDVSMDGSQVNAVNNGDGTFSAAHRFTKTGKHVVQAHVTSGVIDRSAPVVVEVADGGWKTVPQISPRAETGSPVTLKVKMEPVGVPTDPPQKVIAEVSGQKIELAPSGDNTFSGTWTPSNSGKQNIKFTPVGGFNTQAATGLIEIEQKRMAVAPSAPAPPRVSAASDPGPATPQPPAPPSLAAPPDFRLGNPSPIQMDKLKSGSEANAQVVFDDSKIPQETSIEVTTTLNRKGAVLEIQTPEGWKRLGSSPVLLKASANQAAAWPVRLKVAACPQACQPSEQHEIVFATTKASGAVDRAVTPLRVEVTPDPWLQCNWRILAGLGGAVFAGFIAYGFVWPARFGGRLGMQLSPEIDLSEGFYYPLRTQPGAGSSFYRHARVFLHPDFRITGKKPGGSFVKLRAGRKRVYIQPVPGQTVWRQKMDGEWERLSAEESVARENTIYRNDQESVFFDLRLR